MHPMIMAGGLPGLVAAVEAAERGLSVRMYEAHGTLGEAHTSLAPYVAHEGAHVFYSDGPIWAWLRGRGLMPVTAGLRSLCWRHSAFVTTASSTGCLRETSRQCYASSIGPISSSFRNWAARRWGEEVASPAAAASGASIAVGRRVAECRPTAWGPDV